MSNKERMGERLRKLRIALGFKTRPKFADLLGLAPTRLHNIENLNMRMSEIDFEAIGHHYPWALEYLACGGDLIIPDHIDAPVKVVSDLAATSVPAVTPEDMMKALTTDPEMKAAFQKMMIEILQQGLGNDGQ